MHCLKNDMLKEARDQVKISTRNKETDCTYIFKKGSKGYTSNEKFHSNWTFLNV